MSQTLMPEKNISKNTLQITDFSCKIHPSEKILKICTVYDCEKVFLCCECFQTDPTHIEKHQMKIQTIAHFKDSIENGVLKYQIEKLSEIARRFKHQLGSFEELERLNNERIQKDLIEIKAQIVSLIESGFEQIETELIQKSSVKNEKTFNKISVSLENVKQKLNFYQEFQNQFCEKNKREITTFDEFQRTCKEHIFVENDINSDLFIDKDLVDAINFLESNFNDNKTDSLQQYYWFYDPVSENLGQRVLNNLKRKTANFSTSILNDLVSIELPQPLKNIQFCIEVKLE